MCRIHESCTYTYNTTKINVSTSPGHETQDSDVYNCSVIGQIVFKYTNIEIVNEQSSLPVSEI